MNFDVIQYNIHITYSLAIIIRIISRYCYCNSKFYFNSLLMNSRNLRTDISLLFLHRYYIYIKLSKLFTRLCVYMCVFYTIHIFCVQGRRIGNKIFNNRFYELSTDSDSYRILLSVTLSYTLLFFGIHGIE